MSGPRADSPLCVGPDSQTAGIQQGTYDHMAHTRSPRSGDNTCPEAYRGPLPLISNLQTYCSWSVTGFNSSRVCLGVGLFILFCGCDGWRRGFINMLQPTCRHGCLQSCSTYVANFCSCRWYKGRPIHEILNNFFFKCWSHQNVT